MTTHKCTPFCLPRESSHREYNVNRDKHYNTSAKYSHLALSRKVEKNVQKSRNFLQETPCYHPNASHRRHTTANRFSSPNPRHTDLRNHPHRVLSIAPRLETPLRQATSVGGLLAPRNNIIMENYENPQTRQPAKTDPDRIRSATEIRIRPVSHNSLCFDRDRKMIHETTPATAVTAVPTPRATFPTALPGSRKTFCPREEATRDNSGMGAGGARRARKGSRGGGVSAMVSCLTANHGCTRTHHRRDGIQKRTTAPTYF